ncbi:MAG: hypothetical protein AAGE52_01915 [Myxococcota bacterium]
MKPVREAAPRRTIDGLESGRFRIVGRIVPIGTSPSSIDGLDCVFLEHAEYVSMSGAMRREQVHTVHTHPFFLDDGTGRAWIDPAGASIDAVTLWEDGGLTGERRLRAGEEVEVVASFQQVEVEADGGPYRGRSVVWAAEPDPWGPPRVSYRTAPGMVAPSDDISAFLRGAGVFLAAVSVLLAALSWI